MKSPRSTANTAIGAVVLCLATVPGCERSDSPGGESAAKGPEAIIEFPVALRAKDETVNAFVREVIRACVDGDYERFRLLWSATQDPFPRDAFERGWRAVKKVRVLDLGKRQYEGEIVYVVHAEVKLDESVSKPQRQVVLLLAHEAERWRLKHPPANLRKEYLGEPEGEPDATTTTPIVSPSTQPAIEPGD